MSDQMAGNRETRKDSTRRCETMQDTVRAGEQGKESNDGKSGWITLLSITYTLCHHISPPLSYVSAEIHNDRHASTCPHGGGRVFKKAMDLSDASREMPVNTPDVCAYSCAVL